MRSSKGGVVVALLALALGLYAYRSGRLSTLGQAINGTVGIKR